MIHRFRLITKSLPSDKLAILVGALKVAKSTSDALSATPLLGIVAGTILGIVETLQTMHGNKEQCVQLVRRATELLEHVNICVGLDHDSVSPGMNDNLRQLCSSLAPIRRDLEIECQRSRLYQFTHQASITSTISRCIQELDDAWRRFDISCLVTIDKQMKALKRRADGQAKYDDTFQVRLYRWCELEITEHSGTCRILGNYEADEYRAKLKGRSVRVRQFRNDVSTQKPEFSSLLVYNPNKYGYQTNIAQVLGISHSFIEKPFYVVECGTTSLLHNFLNIDGVPLVIHWFTHVAEFWSAYMFARRSEIPVFDGKKGVWHHDEGTCLSSASLSAHGRLLLDASDLYHADVICIQSCISRLHNEARGDTTSVGIGYGFDIKEDDIATVNHLLAVLRSKPQSSVVKRHIDKFMNSPAGWLWSSNIAYIRPGAPAKVGDFGYFDRGVTGEHFVCLGRLQDLLGSSTRTTFAAHCTETQAGATPWRDIQEWPDDTFSHRFTLDKNAMCSEVDSELSILLHETGFKHDQWFFWEHAEDIAQRHHIPLNELILVTEHRYYAKVKSVDPPKSISDLGSETGASNSCIFGHNELYFHYLPILDSGEDRNPWGYWSLTDDPRGPRRDELNVAGIGLHHWKRMGYSHLPLLQAEILRTMNRLRRGEILLWSESRFQEIS